jgi:Holliday junction resolvase RusA-like endonuclease
MITLAFPGMKPCAKARPRVTSNGTYMPQEYRDWKRKFAWLASQEWDHWLRANGHHVPSIIDGPIAVSVEWRTTTGNMRPDVDNALGSVLDALQDALIFANDSQVREIHGRVDKAKKAETGITVTIEEIA